MPFRGHFQHHIEHTGNAPKGGIYSNTYRALKMPLKGGILSTIYRALEMLLKVAFPTTHIMNWKYLRRKHLQPFIKGTRNAPEGGIYSNSYKELKMILKGAVSVSHTGR